MGKGKKDTKATNGSQITSVEGTNQQTDLLIKFNKLATAIGNNSQGKEGLVDYLNDFIGTDNTLNMTDITYTLPKVMDHVNTLTKAIARFGELEFSKTLTTAASNLFLRLKETNKKSETENAFTAFIRVNPKRYEYLLYFLANIARANIILSKREENEARRNELYDEAHKSLRLLKMHIQLTSAHLKPYESMGRVKVDLIMNASWSDYYEDSALLAALQGNYNQLRSYGIKAEIYLFMLFEQKFISGYALRTAYQIARDKFFNDKDYRKAIFYSDILYDINSTMHRILATMIEDKTNSDNPKDKIALMLPIFSDESQQSYIDEMNLNREFATKCKRLLLAERMEDLNAIAAQYPSMKILPSGNINNLPSIMFTVEDQNAKMILTQSLKRNRIKHFVAPAGSVILTDIYDVNCQLLRNALEKYTTTLAHLESESQKKDSTLTPSATPGTSYAAISSMLSHSNNGPTSHRSKPVRPHLLSNSKPENEDPLQQQQQPTATSKVLTWGDISYDPDANNQNVYQLIAIGARFYVYVNQEMLDQLTDYERDKLIGALDRGKVIIGDSQGSQGFIFHNNSIKYKGQGKAGAFRVEGRMTATTKSDGKTFSLFVLDKFTRDHNTTIYTFTSSSSNEEKAPRQSLGK